MKTITTLLIAFAAFLAAPAARAVVDDAHSFALEAATPAVKKGFTVRQEYWSGYAVPKQQQTIQHQLFKGNEYWFWLASDEETATLQVHVYDGGGNLVNAEAWQKGHKAAVRVKPKRTGTYYIVFTVDKSELRRTRWALAYGFK